MPSGPADPGIRPELRRLGRTGLSVPAVGLGAMQLGDPDFPEAEAARLLHGALDRGVSLIDTARAYGESEARIGRVLGPRRDEFLLSTKLGYGVEGVPDWTPESVLKGVDAARDRLRTDRIDIVHLHSCGRDVLEHGGVIEALARAAEMGKLGVVAYSGENEALEFALGHPAIAAVQLSVNLLDQQALAGAVPRAVERGVGVIAKRPLASAAWRRESAEAVYAERMIVLADTLPDEADWPATSLRFAAWAPGVDCCLLGTHRLEHLDAALAAVALGPLPNDTVRALTRAFAGAGRAWGGLV